MWWKTLLTAVVPTVVQTLFQKWFGEKPKAPKTDAPKTDAPKDAAKTAEKKS